MTDDPTRTDPDAYRVILDNDRVRVLEYRDEPGYATKPHHHPDSVMFTLTAFTRRLIGDGSPVDVELRAGVARWLPAQVHAGENIGSSPTHTIFVELKEPSPAPSHRSSALGPDQA